MGILRCAHEPHQDEAPTPQRQGFSGLRQSSRAVRDSPTSASSWLAESWCNSQMNIFVAGRVRENQKSLLSRATLSLPCTIKKKPQYSDSLVIEHYTMQDTQAEIGTGGHRVKACPPPAGYMNT